MSDRFSRNRSLANIGILFALAACGGKSNSPEPEEDPSDGGDRNSEVESKEDAGRDAASDLPEVEIPDPVECGAVTCDAIVLPGAAIAPCCVDAREGICGAEVGGLGGGLLGASCQPLTQAGDPDPTCPDSAGGMVAGFPLPSLQGCCREETGQCGYLITDTGGLLPFAPGCVDSAPFLNGEEPIACGAGADPDIEGPSDVDSGGGSTNAPDAGSDPGGSTQQQDAGETESDATSAPQLDASAGDETEALEGGASVDSGNDVGSDSTNDVGLDPTSETESAVSDSGSAVSDSGVQANTADSSLP